IWKKFLSTFVFAILIFAVLSLAVDMTEKFENFIENALSGSEIVTHYCIAFMPHILAILFPPFIFMPVIALTFPLVYRSDLMASLSTGVSFRRCLRAYWVGGILLALLLGLSNRFLIPRANDVRVKFEDTYSHKKKKDVVLSNLHMRIDS